MARRRSSSKTGGRRRRRVELKFVFVSEAARLERLMSKASRRSLARLGGFGRTAMKHLLRKRGRKVKRKKRGGKDYKARHSSPPGQPPFRVDGTLRRLVFWAFDRARWSVVVGPIRFGKGFVPALHDRGGVRNFHSTATGETYIGHYPARPYSERARDDALKDADKAWKDSLKKV